MKIKTCHKMKNENSVKADNNNLHNQDDRGLQNVYKRKHHDVACISAYSNDSSDNNEERNRQLKAVLLSLGYGVAKMDENLIKYFETINDFVGEQYFFVVNRHSDDDFLQNLLDLANYYNQDHFHYRFYCLIDPFTKGTINYDVYENYSRGARMSIKAIYERIMNRISEMKMNNQKNQVKICETITLVPLRITRKEKARRLEH